MSCTSAVCAESLAQEAHRIGLLVTLKIRQIKCTERHEPTIGIKPITPIYCTRTYRSSPVIHHERHVIVIAASHGGH